MKQKNTLGKKGREKIYFVFIVIGLIAQLIFVYKFTEPYPAIIMPAFSGTPSNKNIVKVDEYTLKLYFHAGDSSRMEGPELFDFVFDWHVPYIFEFILEKSKNRDNYETPERREFEDWIEQKIKKKLDRTDIRSIVFLKREKTFDLNNRFFLEDSNLISSEKFILN